MSNLILSTFRHPEFFDNSRIITGTITESLFKRKMPNDTMISSYYELAGSKSGGDGSINLRPYIDYQSIYKSNHCVIPWWIDHSEENYDLYASSYWKWLRASINEIGQETNGIIEVNAGKLLAIVDEFDQPSSKENLGYNIAIFSQALVNQLNPIEPSQVVSYANSDANNLFLSFSLERLTDDGFQSDLNSLMKNNEIDWCYSYQSSPMGITKIGNNPSGWFSREIDTITGKVKGGKKALSSGELISLIENNRDKPNKGILALGFYTDILRYMLFEKVSIYHLGDDRDCMKYISEKQAKSEVSSLQLLNRKSESFDPFEEREGRKLTLIEAFLLNGIIDVEAHVHEARKKQHDIVFGLD